MNDLFSLSHKDDPVTSYAAGDRMEKTGKRESDAMAVVKVLQAHDGLTSAEIAKHMTGDWKDWLTPARRLSELERNNIVRKGPARACWYKNTTCVTWWLVK